MAEKKNNMATRFCDEIINRIEVQIRIYRDEADKASSEARAKRGQADALDIQIGNIKDSLAKGNYEKNNEASE